MKKLMIIALSVLVMAVCVASGYLLAVHRQAVGRFIAGEAAEVQSEPEHKQSEKRANKPVSQATNAPVVKTNATPTLSPVPAEPVIGWKTLKSETVSLDPLNYKAVGSVSRAARAKIGIDADSAVFFGVFQMSTLEQYKQARKVIRQQDFQSAKCGQVGILKTEIECELEPGDVILLRDKRAEGSMLLGAFGALGRNSESVERATRGNRVHYEVAEWTCVEHCRL
jgi:hypothetical protein